MRRELFDNSKLYRAVSHKVDDARTLTDQDEYKLFGTKNCVPCLYFLKCMFTIKNRIQHIFGKGNFPWFKSLTTGKGLKT